MTGELVDIGRRPKLVASFAGRGARERFEAWRDENADLLAGVPVGAIRVEYGAAASRQLVRVRIDETHLPPGLEGPDEAGPADGLPPRLSRA